MKEAAKEFARMIALAVLPVAIASLQSETFSFRAFGLAVSLAALRAVDKWIHVSDKIKLNGLVPW